MEGEEMSAGTRLDRLLTIQEVCELLRVKKTYVYWLTYQKKIPDIKMQGHLRFRQSAIDEWLDSQEVRNDASLQEEV
jgi:excisionase family DNA binding protein